MPPDKPLEERDQGRGNRGHGFSAQQHHGKGLTCAAGDDSTEARVLLMAGAADGASLCQPPPEISDILTSLD
jgi:hypothetical protein